MRRVAVVASHPIQYQAPWFRALAGVCDLTVFYCHRQDAAGQARAGFAEPFDWDVPLLDGYRSEWLPNVSPAPGVDRFAGCDTPAIAERLAAGRFDACVVNGWYLKSYLQTFRACRQQGIPVVVRGDSQLKGPRSALKVAAKYLPYRWLMARMDAHLFVGDANRAYLRHYGVASDRMFFAPHFVETARFARQARRAHDEGEVDRLRSSWHVSPTTTVFLFAGKFIDKKRPSDLIDAVAQVRSRGGDVHAVFVGSGPDAEALRWRARELCAPVTFDGFQNQSRIAAWYAAADCLVLPSDGRETWGLVVNEAMAAGRPAIVSDEVGCAPDLIDEGQTGYTFSVGDVGALADRMIKATALCSTRVSETRAAVRARIAGYSCEAAVAGTMSAIESVTNRLSHRQRAMPQVQDA